MTTPTPQDQTLEALAESERPPPPASTPAEHELEHEDFTANDAREVAAALRERADRVGYWDVEHGARLRRLAVWFDGQAAVAERMSAPPPAAK